MKRINEIILEEKITSLLEKKIEKKLLQSENDYKQGKVKDASEVFNEWKIKYGI